MTYSSVSTRSFLTSDELTTSGISRPSRHLVIIDSSVDNYQHLVDSVVDGTSVFVLDTHHDGIQQITEILQHQTLESTSQPLSLHLIAHGAPGLLYLGNGELSLTTLNDQSATLQSWPIGELAIYGCQVAAGDAGAEFITALHTLTQANIAASTSLIGHVDLGGTWHLDFKTHETPVESILNRQILEWQGVLAVEIINPTGGVEEDGADGLRLYLGDNGQIQIQYRDSFQLFSPSATPENGSLFNGIFVAVGDTVVGTSDNHRADRTWEPLEQSEVSGRGTERNPFVVTTTVYDDANENGRYDANSEIQLDYVVSYVSGDAFFSQSYELDVPDNNSEVIKLYHLVDTYLEGGDNGPAYGLDRNGNEIEGVEDDPVLLGTVKNLEEENESFLAFVQSDSDDWDSWYSGFYDTQFTQTDGGSDIVKTFDTNESTDNGIGVQYTLGEVTGDVIVNNFLTFESDTAIDVIEDEFDNDSGEPGVTLSATRLRVDEARARGSFTFIAGSRPTSEEFTVVLDSRPSSDVVFNVVTTDSSEVELSTNTLTFTRANWDTPQTVTVTGVYDGIYERSNQRSQVVVRVDDENSDDDFDSLRAQRINVTTVHVGPTPNDDRILGRDSNNTVFALDGDDLVLAGGGNDRIIGQSGNDTLRGGDGNDLLNGGEGRDRLNGQNGDDTLRGKNGRDLLNGGNGNDTLLGQNNSDRLFGGNGNDDLRGGQGADQLRGQAGRDRLSGGGNDDVLVGGGGRDRLFGDAGNDRLVGNAGQDRLVGGSGNDTLNGGGRNDRLNGQGGNDTLRGLNGRDVLRGGNGRDLLVGGNGNDIIVTGNGRDVIKVSQQGGRDLVKDFTDGQDRINVIGIEFNQLTLEQRNNNVLVSVGDQSVLLLQNTDLDQLDEDDFI